MNLQKWFIVVLLWFDYFVIYIHRNDIFFVFPLLEKDLRFTAFELGLIGTVFQWTYSLVSPFVGYAGDRYQRRNILIASAFLSTGCTTILGMCTNSSQVIMLRAILAISQAASVPAAVSLIADVHGPKTRSTAVGIYLTSPFAGLFTSGVFGGRLAQTFGWRWSFFCFAALGLLMAACLWCMLVEPPRSSEPQAPSAPRGSRQQFWSALRAFLSSKTCLAVATVFTLDGAVRSTITTWLPLFFYEKFAFTLSRAGYFSTAYIQTASMLGVVCGGRAGDWAAQKSFRGRIFVQILGLMGMVPALYLMGSSGSLGILSASMLAYGLGVGLNQANMWPTTFQVITPSARSTAVGMLNCIGGILGGWAPAAAGALKSQIGLERIIASTSLLALACAAIYVVTMIWFLPRESAESENIRPLASRRGRPETSSDSDGDTDAS
jgi:MFS family permease